METFAPGEALERATSPPVSLEQTLGDLPRQVIQMTLSQW